MGAGASRIRHGLGSGSTPCGRPGKALKNKHPKVQPHNVCYQIDTPTSKEWDEYHGWLELFGCHWPDGALDRKADRLVLNFSNQDVPNFDCVNSVAVLLKICVVTIKQGIEVRLQISHGDLAATDVRAGGRVQHALG